MSIQVDKNNIHIDNSYGFSKKGMKAALETLKTVYPTCEVWARSINSLRREWVVHNVLYRIGYQRDRTKSVDLDYPQKWYMSLGYNVLGALLWIFVK